MVACKPISYAWSTGRSTSIISIIIKGLLSSHVLVSASKSGVPMNINGTHYSPQSPRMKEFKGESPTSVATPGSWPESVGGGSGKNSISFSSTSHHLRRPTFSQIVSSGPPTEEKKRVVVEITPNIKLRR
ncbi:hypothetical protein PHLCEN_2v6394 [Hermanssonia centrifuga]|uniref:Uncharacterized protein n=1 Tax=Hermanssonia centrifuga TaxID=98765 RepID=A0A2R6NZI8_9APHY|nr:hypothetical protein PHLCEN_2v6394 [Hermanssonia centrifuga]